MAAIFGFVRLVAEQQVQPLLEGAGGDFAQHGVDEGRGSGADHGAGQADGLVQRGVGGDAHGQQLVGADPQRVEDGRVQLVQRPVHAAGQDGVVGALAAQGAVAQFRGEAGVALVQAVVPDPGGQHEVGVGVLGGDGAQHFEGHEPGGVGPAGALGGRVLGEAALRTAVAFPALRVPLAAVPPRPPWPPPRWLPPGRRAGGRCRGRCRLSRTRSFEYHAFKCCLSARPVGGGHHFLARRLDPGEFHRVRTGSHQHALALQGQLPGFQRRSPGPQHAPAPA